jgi:hypothetical protein
MVERHYGTLLSGAASGIASRLAAFGAEQDHAASESRSSLLLGSRASPKVGQSTVLRIALGIPLARPARL